MSAVSRCPTARLLATKRCRLIDNSRAGHTVAALASCYSSLSLSLGLPGPLKRPTPGAASNMTDFQPPALFSSAEQGASGGQSSSSASDKAFSSAKPLESITTHDQYHNAGLSKSDLPHSPINLFHTWFEQAKRANILAPETMTLSTARVVQGSNGAAQARPSSRVVLLKTLDQRGFIFFTNYASRKSGELLGNPWCSLTFYYDQPLHRSVRVCGRAEKLDKKESQTYFDTRPLGSRIGAHASPQSQVIGSRKELEERVQEVENSFGVPGAAGLHGAPPPDEGKKIPVPEHWGGWRVIPDEIEFWLGRENRLHDRFRYTRSLDSGKDAADDTWQLDQLAP